MRIYWTNGALLLEPETRPEWDALVLLGDNIKLGVEARPAGLISSRSADNTGNFGCVVVARDEVRTD
jgi:hypothetical protein